MFVGIWQSIVTLAMIVAFYAADVALMRRYDPLRDKGSSRSWSWTALSLAAAIIVVGQPIVWPRGGWATDAGWGLVVQIVGLVMMAAGLVVHWWARLHLRQFYGERIEFQERQYLVTTGPYAYVRHPIYTSFFLCIVGLLLVNPSVPVLLVTLYFFYDFLRVARREEAMLRASLAGYGEYMARTPAYLPRLRRATGGR